MASTLTTFMRSFNSKVEEPVRQHLKNVYACLSLATVVASMGAALDLYIHLSGMLSVAAGLVFLLLLQGTKPDGKNNSLRLGYLLGFSFTTGLSFGQLLEQVVIIDPSLIPTALFCTTIIFVSFTLASLMAKRGSWLFLGGTLATILLSLLVFSLASIFFSSRLVLQVHVYIGLFLMCGFVLYDTQLIMEKRRAGDKDFIGHSVDLFIDFVGIFRRLLIILTMKESDKKDRKRN